MELDINAAIFHIYQLVKPFNRICVQIDPTTCCSWPAVLLRALMYS